MTLNTSSFVVFLKFIDTLEAAGAVNVDRVFSKECYEFWLSTRTFPPKRPEESFRKALTSHCRGVDGRKPFPPDIEAALLRQMRKKQVWECFKGTQFNIGKRGYQVRGFWESSNDAVSESAAHSGTKRKIEDHETVTQIKRSNTSSSAPVSPLQAGMTLNGDTLQSLLAFQNIQQSMMGYGGIPSIQMMPNFGYHTPFKNDFFLGQPAIHLMNAQPFGLSSNMNLGLLEMLHKATSDSS